MVVARRRRPARCGRRGDDLGGVRLDHQVADGEHQPAFVDDDAGALALAAEVLHRAAVRVDEGLDLAPPRKRARRARSPAPARRAGDWRAAERREQQATAAPAVKPSERRIWRIAHLIRRKNPAPHYNVMSILSYRLVPSSLPQIPLYMWDRARCLPKDPMPAPRLLVMEGNSQATRAQHVAAGGTVASTGYANLLQELLPTAIGGHLLSRRSRRQPARSARRWRAMTASPSPAPACTSTTAASR